MIHHRATITPGIPGDSGSAFIDKRGRASASSAPWRWRRSPHPTGVGDLKRELQYLASHTSLSVTLANGTEPFWGPLLPA